MLNHSQNPQQGTALNRQSIGHELERLLKDPGTTTDQGNQLFHVRTASQWMESSNARPIPQMLFGEFWFEGELCILFADSNLGKSILAVQVGNSISRHEPILYFDFELADKQFEARYSVNYTGHYNFTGNFLRAELNPTATPPPQFTTFEAFMIGQVEQLIIRHQAKVLIIDNLTYLRSETERAKDALPLMKELKTLKSKYGLSILALAHTPKRDTTKPITRNDLQGSKMLMNFCDSAFAIGESQQDRNLRYVKQIKQRNTEEKYGADNVCMFSISKESNFLRYDFEGYDKEWEHLRKPEDQDREKLKTQVIELKSQGKSLREIGRELGISYMKADRLLKASQ
jgi:predicted ATP-dependent serine protease